MSNFSKEINKMLKDIDLEEDYNSKSTTDVEKIANELGYEIVYFFPKTGKEFNTSGILDYNSKNIYINNMNVSERQRFTIAHEIGHICLHKKNRDGIILEYRNKKYNKKERDANEFGAELLMPKEKIEELHTQYEDDYEKVYELAQKFDVSKSAMEIRLLRLGIIGK